ncbi:MAG TPA: hypothetical protein VN625_06930 [Desulfuromonadaceae bacterium]|nr:hypothetical protein [Desulfuromonadaceae bacterium]
MIKFLLCAVVLSGGLVGCSTTDHSYREYVSRPDKPGEATEILSYSKPSPETLRHIKVSRVALTSGEWDKLSALPRDTGAWRWLVAEEPDTMRPGPWNTRLYIFNAGETNRCVRLELNDNWGRVDRKWLNDKLLFVEVWFGRIAWTDFILDAETLKFLYIEDGRDDFTFEEQSR